MAKKSKLDSVIYELKEKHEALSQDTNLFLEGFLHSKQLTYWDYINTDALLNLQIQRTDYPDEMVFITYHQIAVSVIFIKTTSHEYHQRRIGAQRL